MAVFELVPIQEAMAASAAAGKRVQIAQEYASYVARLRPGEAGRLIPSAGETVATVRRRLGTAVRASGRSIKIRRVSPDIYFWDDPPKRRGGRPRKNPIA